MEARRVGVEWTGRPTGARPGGERRRVVLAGEVVSTGDGEAATSRLSKRDPAAAHSSTAGRGRAAAAADARLDGGLDGRRTGAEEDVGGRGRKTRRRLVRWRAEKEGGGSSTPAPTPPFIFFLLRTGNAAKDSARGGRRGSREEKEAAVHSNGVWLWRHTRSFSSKSSVPSWNLCSRMGDLSNAMGC